METQEWQVLIDGDDFGAVRPQTLDDEHPGWMLVPDGAVRKGGMVSLLEGCGVTVLGAPSDHRMLVPDVVCKAAAKIAEKRERGMVPRLSSAAARRHACDVGDLEQAEQAYWQEFREELKQAITEEIAGKLSNDKP